jgi:hypothetical protein
MVNGLRTVGIGVLAKPTPYLDTPQPPTPPTDPVKQTFPN